MKFLARSQLLTAFSLQYHEMSTLNLGASQAWVAGSSYYIGGTRPGALIAVSLLKHIIGRSFIHYFKQRLHASLHAATVSYVEHAEGIIEVSSSSTHPYEYVTVRGLTVEDGSGPCASPKGLHQSQQQQQAVSSKQSWGP